MSEVSQQFSHIVRDLDVDPEAFKLNMAATSPPRCRYVIMFTARSGSTWLTSLLSATGKLGYPEEYINPEFIRDVAQFLNTRDPAAFLTALARRRQTPNGIFGMEVRAPDIEMFQPDVFFQFFDQSTHFFNLWRKNLVAQAISLYRAVATKRYHSNDGKPDTGPPDYDVKAITDWLQHMANEENANFRMLTQRKLPFTNLCYEDMVANRLNTLHLFARVLEVDPKDLTLLPAARDEVKKIGDNWNLEAEKLFRADQQRFIADIERNRIVKTVKPRPE
jgi:LPS sulfotransferase NodH